MTRISVPLIFLAHLSYLLLNVLGDTTYGGSPFTPAFLKEVL